MADDTTSQTITWRHRATTKIAQLERLTALLAAIHATVAREHTRAALFDEVCRRLVELGEFPLAWIDSVNEADRSINPIAARATGEQDPQRLPLWTNEAWRRLPQIEAAIQSGRVVICNDVWLDENLSTWRSVQLDHYQSLAAVPLHMQEQISAVLLVCAANREFFDQAEQNLLEQIKVIVSYALENIEREAACQQIQTALHESEDKSALVFRAIPELILINRIADGLILEVNDAAQQFLGYSRAALTGQSLADVHLWNEPAEYQIFLDRLLEKGCYHNLAAAFRTATGDTVPMLVSGCLVELEGQSCIVSISRDMTEHRRMEEALRAGHERYRTLVENVPIAVYRTTPGLRGSFLMVNPAFCAMLGYTKQELRQTAVADIYHTPSERQQFSDRVLQESRVTNVELRLRRKDGSLFWGAVNAQVVRQPDGEVNYFDCTMEDITARKEVEQRLREVNQHLQAIIHSSPLAIMELDIHGHVQLWNPAAEQLFGWTAAEVLGQLNPIVPPEQRAEFYAVHQRIVEGENISPLEVRRRGKDGRLIDLLLSRAPILNEAGQPIGGLAILANITERKQAEAAEREQRALAEALHDTATALSSTLQLDEVLDRVLENVGKIVPYDSASILLIEDGVARCVRLHGHREPGTEAAIMALRLPLIDTQNLRYVAETGQALVIADVHNYPAWNALPGLEWIHSHLSAPLHIKGQTVGFLSLDSAQIDFFTAQHAAHLRAFADQAAVALENAQLYDRVQRHAEELETRVADRTAELDRERQRLRAILDTAGEGIYFTDRQGKIEYINPAMERLTGYSSAEALGQDPALWHSGHTSEAVFAEMRRVMLRGEIWRGEVVNRRKDGTLYDTALIVAPLNVTASQLGGFVAIARDITRQKELDRLKDQFVANVSHELRTPLTNIKLYVTLLQQGASDKRPQYWLTLQREVKRLEGLIENLLSISRLDIGQAPIELEVLDVNGVVRQLLNDRAALIGERGLTIDAALEADMPPALANANFVSQILSNLVTNATQYTPPGGQIVVSTARRSDRDRSWITFTVKDTGSGINADDLPRLFERFYRGEAGRRSGTPGTGLGLAICSDLADKLGGHITVASPPGQGAAFTVWLKPMGGQP
jgi:PAS domain S-box-containing protein